MTPAVQGRTPRAQTPHSSDASELVPLLTQTLEAMQRRYGCDDRTGGEP